MIIAARIMEAAGIPVGSGETVKQRIDTGAARRAIGARNGAVAGTIAMHVIGFLAIFHAAGDGNLAGPVLNGCAVDAETGRVLHLGEY